jgi:LysM repeat protein
VTISDATAGATIYYTTNGTTPTKSSTKYTGAITISATESLEAIAVETGFTNSVAASAAYTIAPVLPAPTFSLAAGTYSTSQTVKISDAKSTAVIYYTTNGTAPSTSSTKYSGPVTVSATETLEAIAIEAGYTNSAVASAAYTIPSDFVISISPNSLSFAAGQSAQSTVRIDPVAGLNQAVSFGCAGLPAGLSCAFSPSSVKTGGTLATTTLTIAANTSVAVHRGRSPLVPISTAAILFCAIGFRRRRRFHFGLFIAGLALGLTASSGCGAFHSTMPPAPVASTVTVTATAGTIQRTASLTVTVN